MKALAFLFACCLFASLRLFSQNTCPPFWSDIQAFKKADGAQKPPQGAILFIGSSSFTKWRDVQDYFPEYTIINRGFGGSHLTDLIRYAYDVVLPYKPRQVLIYCGENDLADDTSATANDVATRFKTLFGMIRQNLPGTEIDFISLKPSPSRKVLFPKFREANELVKAFLNTQKKAAFIDAYTAMLNKDGEPRKDIFIEDNLHMNAGGYRIWQKVILPYLKR